MTTDIARAMVDMNRAEVELSRAPFASNAEKAAGVLSALTAWVEQCG